ncbi:Uncharacterized conserved protein YtfP, gamma-glutamylcyclotransferase (GGCT)/AIG2-like family [Lentzea jiangxiensis]|uniref:Uncharacterized conserved protein YtfP, gamma-glutamylcyclotransferase (GGCT)/AIG2-like family n=2 Tax=Lentzea jiangxiensis TaxID=641025 RepID=A0A1H0X4H1_9PSEU|nr:Uncharacterized conserved protein YtfP, gamma-glutamylcyclotransferase (GGCT)/AIG2-like family [Lentzea jiangxiensis]
MRQHPAPERERDTQLPIFTYGTLRNGLFNYDRVLRGRTLAEQPAVLHGCVLYDAGGFPFAVRKISRTDRIVVGELMTIKPDHYRQVLDELDELEGCDDSDPGALFTRVVVSVNATGTSVQAWMYQAGDTVERDFTEADQIVDGDWVSHHNRIRCGNKTARPQSS